MKNQILKTLAIATLVITASSASAVDLSQFSKQEVAEIASMCENDPSSVGEEVCDSFVEFALDTEENIEESSTEFELLSATSEVDDVCEFDSSDKDCD